MYPRSRLMSRLQLALNVPDIDEAVTFYTRLFGAEPNKRKPAYANFVLTDPPLKLVLFENADAPARLNHLGVEVPSTDEVAAHQARLTDEGLAPVDESGTCCFATQEKVWVDGPDGPWEIYTVVEDSDEFGASSVHVPDEAAADAACCTSMPESAARCC
jgi:catechol 2,3-dioxygenase-like lactoylglutathione lyase family enzyme